jgi:N-acetylneuraminate synthase
MTPATWREMVDRTRELELALGGAVKRVEDNESQTVVVQRRCVRAAGPLRAGTVLARPHVAVLRPAPLDAIFPYDLDRVLGKRLRVDLEPEDHLTWTMLDDPPAAR